MGYPGHKLRLLPLPTDSLVAAVGWTFAENNGGREIKMEVGEEEEEKGDEKWLHHRACRLSVAWTKHSFRRFGTNDLLFSFNCKS